MLLGLWPKVRVQEHYGIYQLVSKQCPSNAVAVFCKSWKSSSQKMLAPLHISRAEARAKFSEFLSQLNSMLEMPLVLKASLTESTSFLMHFSENHPIYDTSYMPRAQMLNRLCKNRSFLRLKNSPFGWHYSDVLFLTKKLQHKTSNFIPM